MPESITEPRSIDGSRLDEECYVPQKGDIITLSSGDRTVTLSLEKVGYVAMAGIMVVKDRDKTIFVGVFDQYPLGTETEVSMPCSSFIRIQDTPSAETRDFLFTAGRRLTTLAEEEPKVIRPDIVTSYNTYHTITSVTVRSELHYGVASPLDAHYAVGRTALTQVLRAMVGGNIETGEESP